MAFMGGGKGGPKQREAKQEKYSLQTAHSKNPDQ